MASLNRVKGLLKKGVKFVRTKDLSGIKIATEDNFDDIGAAVNEALERAGPDGAVFVEPKRYVKENDNPLETPIETQYRDQTVFAWGADVELADGVNDEPVKINHVGFTLENLNILGNEDNNSIQSALISDNNVSDISIRDIDVSGAPVGIYLVGVEDSFITGSNTAESGANVGVGIRMDQCDSVTISDTSVTGFTDTGVNLNRCSDISTASFVVSPADGASANAGVLLHGTVNSSINVVVDADDNVSEGVKSQVFDPGGANETVPDGNSVKGNVNGVSDIGIVLSDAESEEVKLNINGGHSNGRTTQAFLIEEPEGVTNASHRIDINGSTLTRVTDTQLSGTNLGVTVRGHYIKIQETSTYQLGGESFSRFTFGNAVANPAMNVLTGTDMAFNQLAKKAATGAGGIVNVDWSNKFALDDKPNINVTLEQAGQWHVDSWSTDANGRYTDVDIQVTDSAGADVGNNVDVNARVVGV